MAACSPQLSPWSAACPQTVQCPASHTEASTPSVKHGGPQDEVGLPRAVSQAAVHSWGVPAAGCEPMASRVGGQETDRNFHKEFRYWEWIKKRERSENGYVINLKENWQMGNAGSLNPKGFSVLLRIQHWYKPYSSEVAEAECSMFPFNILVGK